MMTHTSPFHVAVINWLGTVQNEKSREAIKRLLDANADLIERITIDGADDRERARHARYVIARLQRFKKDPRLVYSPAAIGLENHNNGKIHEVLDELIAHFQQWDDAIAEPG